MCSCTPYSTHQLHPRQDHHQSCDLGPHIGFYFSERKTKMENFIQATKWRRVLKMEKKRVLIEESKARGEEISEDKGG
uniref:Uncharacterized protein n=1 Tax=Nelumbo nucifera TaxID=4432 RepID=A0A822Y8I2_NELNU|nr:TPA_asm: hypothetical protein HUJ06_030040 [Nelumbo nucifera]